MQHEHTEHVAAAPDAVYAAISDLSNLPKFVPQLTGARRAGDGQVEVDARYEGHEQHGSASFNTNDDERKIEWGAGLKTMAISVTRLGIRLPARR